MVRAVLLLAVFLVTNGAVRASPTSAQVPMPVDFPSLLLLPRRAPAAELAYGSSPSQRVLMWRPAMERGPSPVVVLLHGGCWSAAYGVDHVEALAVALVDEGFAVWAPEYRRVGEPGGGWPGTLDDVAAAIDLLAAQTDAALDLEQVVLVGHSAGGHLALWGAGRRSSGPQSPPGGARFVVRGVVGLAAITDLVAFGASPGPCAAAVGQLLGGSPEEVPQRYREAAPASNLSGMPVVLVHGTRDPIVPMRQSESVVGASVRMVGGAGHFDLVHPGTAAFPVLVEELRRMVGSGEAAR